MNKQRAVYLMLELGCWHEQDDVYKGLNGHCKHCGKEFMCLGVPDAELNPDLTTWPGFGIMWEQAQKMEWWVPFLKWIWVHEDQLFLGRMNIGVKFINPETFMNLLYEFRIASERIKEES